MIFCLRPSLLPGGSNHRPAKPAAVLSKWCWWDPGERNFGSWDSSDLKRIIIDGSHPSGPNIYVHTCELWLLKMCCDLLVLILFMTPPLASRKSFSQFLPCSHAIPWSFTTFVNAVSVSASASTHRFHRTVPVTLPDLMIYICVYHTCIQSISNLECSWTRGYQSGILATHQFLMSPILLLELSTLGGKGFPCWQKNNGPNAFDDDVDRCLLLWCAMRLLSPWTQFLFSWVIP